MKARWVRFVSDPYLQITVPFALVLEGTEGTRLLSLDPSLWARLLPSQQAIISHALDVMGRAPSLEHLPISLGPLVVWGDWLQASEPTMPWEGWTRLWAASAA